MGRPPSSSAPITTSPTIPPSRAAAVSRPTRLRLPVGNSSLRYTASAGKAIAPTIPPSIAANHIGGPPIE